MSKKSHSPALPGQVSVVREDAGGDDDDKSVSSKRIRKRDKFLNFFWCFSPEPKVKVKPQSSSPKVAAHRLSTTSTTASVYRFSTVGNHDNIEIEQAVTSTAVQSPVSKLEPSTLSFNLRIDIFTQNVEKPAVLVSLPGLGTRISTTPQLVFCLGLLPKDGDTGEQQPNPSENVSSEPPAQLAWIKAMKQDPVEKEHIRSLGTCMVEEFAKDALKDSTEIAEMVLLGPVLDRETYRKLLSCAIAAFDQAILLDVNHLQGVVQLVQSASSESLLPDDLVKILRILRLRLQDTHQQISVHPFHLTLAVSRVLDVMADHGVKDVSRVEEREPLSGVLSGLKGSSDPYLMYQACYAYQALQYVPDDETVLQAVIRNSTGVVDGLVNVSAVFKLDLGSVLEGLGKLHEALGGVIGTASAVYDGVCSVMESGQGVLESLKKGLGSGEKRPWYAAIRAAYALAEAGQLKDLNRLIYEAPCRRDPLFQWGICQLLGEIASDTIRDSTVRQEAVDLLGELFKNDPEWNRDETVKTWMLNIISQLSSIDDQTVRIKAHNLFEELTHAKGITTSLPYPLRSRLPMPLWSPILARVQKIPLVEYDLHRLRASRLKQSHQTVYIPPLAKANLTAKDDGLFSLMEKVQEFLASERQVMLVLGDSGAGKSTFNHHLEHLLWTDYKQGGPVPLFIDLPGIHEPYDDLVAKQLRDYNFDEDQIKELKLHRKLILICDGYDESQQLVNLHYTNKLNQPGQWDTKMIISCRTQFLGPTYRDRFKPQSNDRYAFSLQDLFQEAVIAPFSKQQIENYVEQYVPLEPRTWRTQDYMDRLTTIPNLLDLVRNPFLLSLALQALPGVAEGQKDLSKIKITRVQLYDTFVHHWLGVNQRRLESNALSDDDRDMLVQLTDAGFVSLGVEYSTKLALAIFDKQDGNPMVQYVQFSDKNTWKAEFFGPQPEIRLLRESSPLTRTGNQFRFIHRSIMEYFVSRDIYYPVRIDKQEFDPQAVPASPVAPSIDTNGPLFRRNLLKDPSIILFLCDRVKSNPDFEQELRGVVDLSKTDASAMIAATNAITVLVKAGALFNGADLRGVNIPGADLSDGQFDSAQLQGADLTGVILSGSWLRQADLSGARLEGVRFGELPYLDTGDSPGTCTYSPNGKMLAMGFGYNSFCIYDTSTWTLLQQQNTIIRWVHDIAFSPDNQQIVLAGRNGSVRTWDCTSGVEVLSMSGHTNTENVKSVAFSPCGKQIVSASDDHTVRLWDSQTGESSFALEGHTRQVLSVKYSPDGRQLVSGGWDETIRFWDPETGEPGAVLSPSLGGVHSLAYSPDGRWIASGHTDGDLQLWNAATGEPGLILRGHSSFVTGIEFSPSGQWIASSSYDKTVRLWDASTGALVSVLTGHGTEVMCVAFSPDGLQVASGGLDGKVRLWEVGSAWSSTDARDGGRVNQIAYAPDGRTILAQDSSRVFRKWDAGTGISESFPLEMAEPHSVSCIAFTRDDSQFAVGYYDESIHLWNRQTSTAGPVLEGHSSHVRILVYSPCYRWIASVDKNNTVRLWDLHNTEQHRVLVEVDEGLEGEICAVVFSPTGDQLAVGSKRGTVRLFNLPSMERLACNYRSDAYILSMVYSPNGRQIAIGSLRRCIYLWDLQSEEPSAKLDGYNSWVQCIAYSSCGQWIASGSEKTVEIWRRQLSGEDESWLHVCSICSFFKSVDHVTWNPKVPMELVTGCSDRSVRVWRMSHDDGGNVVVKMLWGSNLGMLYAESLILDGSIDLSPVNQKLLVQRGALDGVVVPRDLLTWRLFGESGWKEGPGMDEFSMSIFALSALYIE